MFLPETLPPGAFARERRIKGFFETASKDKGGFLNGSVVKNLPAMQETRVPSLSGEDPLEKGMATHSRILAWRTPWTEEPGGLQSIGSQGQTRLKQLSTHTPG